MLTNKIFNFFGYESQAFRLAVEAIESSNNYRAFISEAEIIRLIKMMQKTSKNPIPDDQIAVITKVTQAENEILTPKLSGKFYKIIQVDQIMECGNFEKPEISVGSDLIICVSPNGTTCLYSLYRLQNSEIKPYLAVSLDNFLKRRSLFEFEDIKSSNARALTLSGLNETAINYLMDSKNGCYLKLLLAYFSLPNVNFLVERTELLPLSEANLLLPEKYEVPNDCYVLFIPKRPLPPTNPIWQAQQERLDNLKTCLKLEAESWQGDHAFSWQHEESVEWKMKANGCVTPKTFIIAKTAAIFFAKEFLFDKLYYQILGLTQEEAAVFWPQYTNRALLATPSELNRLTLAMFTFKQSNSNLYTSFKHFWQNTFSFGYSFAKTIVNEVFNAPTTNPAEEESQSPRP